MPPTTPTAHADTLVVSSQSNFLRAGGPVLLQAYRVEIQGVVSSRGQDVTIVANQLAFTTPDALIDTSGDDALNAHVPGDKPDPPVDQPGIDLQGTTGTTGARGTDGARGGNVKIYATRIFGTLRIKAIGGKAGRAQDGGDGGRGGNRAIPSAEPGDDCQGVRGEPGTSGGQGGMAGPPGIAGQGGSVDVYLGIPPSANASYIAVVDLSGGAAPDNALPGNGGPGGIPGQSPRCTARPEPGRPTPTGRPGPPGRVGSVGALQASAAAGTPGMFCGLPFQTNPAPFNTLADHDFALQCSPQQVWDVLQVAETLYLNEDLVNAAPRLAWVSMVARLMPQQA